MGTLGARKRRAGPSVWRKVVLFLVGMVLVPTGLAALRTIRWQVLYDESGTKVLDLPASMGWCLTGVIVAGLLYVAGWIPTRWYVWAHEWTHVLFGRVTGSRVGGPVFRKDAGYVRVTKPNVVETLAPYFFPLPAVVLLLVYRLAAAVAPIRGTVVEAIAYATVGAAFGLHVLFTINAVFQRQTDLDLYGFFFSVVFFVTCGLVVSSVFFWALSGVSARDYFPLAGSLWVDTHLRLMDELVFNRLVP